MILRGKTQKGKNRIRELGAEWNLIRRADSVLFSTEPGDWLFITPATGQPDKERWIHETRDPHFEIVN